MASLSQFLLKTVGAALALGSIAGCSTSYMPRSSGRVSVVQVGGIPSYARGGKIYHGGLGGGELEEAVQGNPAAEQHARDYKAGTITGFVSALVGGVGMCAGVGLLAADSAAHESHRGRQIGGAATLGVGVVAYVVGLALVINAQPHMWDAINIYNDGVQPPPVPPSKLTWPAVAPGSSARGTVAPPALPSLPPASPSPSAAPPGSAPAP